MDEKHAHTQKKKKLPVLDVKTVTCVLLEIKEFTKCKVPARWGERHLFALCFAAFGAAASVSEQRDGEDKRASVPSPSYGGGDLTVPRDNGGKQAQMLTCCSVRRGEAACCPLNQHRVVGGFCASSGAGDWARANFPGGGNVWDRHCAFASESTLVINDY